MILYIRCSRLFWIYFKKTQKKTDNPSIKVYVNETETRSTFKFKAGNYVELLTPEMMKLLGSTKKKINKDKAGKNFHWFGFSLL